MVNPTVPVAVYIMLITGNGNKLSVPTDCGTGTGCASVLSSCDRPPCVSVQTFCDQQPCNSVQKPCDEPPCHGHDVQISSGQLKEIQIQTSTTPAPKPGNCLYPPCEDVNVRSDCIYPPCPTVVQTINPPLEKADTESGKQKTVSTPPPDTPPLATVGKLRPDLTGSRIKSDPRPHVYLILDGTRRHIPNIETYNLLFRDWNGIRVLSESEVSSIPEMAALSHQAVLAKAAEHPAVYLISNGVKRWIESPAVMGKYHFKWENIKVYPKHLIDAIPTGASIR